MLRMVPLPIFDGEDGSGQSRRGGVVRGGGPGERPHPVEMPFGKLEMAAGRMGVGASPSLVQLGQGATRMVADIVVVHGPFWPRQDLQSLTLIKPSQNCDQPRFAGQLAVLASEAKQSSAAEARWISSALHASQ